MIPSPICCCANVDMSGATSWNFCSAKCCSLCLRMPDGVFLEVASLVFIAIVCRVAGVLPCSK